MRFDCCLWSWPLPSGDEHLPANHCAAVRRNLLRMAARLTVLPPGARGVDGPPDRIGFRAPVTDRRWQRPSCPLTAEWGLCTDPSGFRWHG